MKNQKSTSLRRWHLGLLSFILYLMLSAVLGATAPQLNISWLATKESLPNGGFALTFTIWMFVIPMAISLVMYALLNYIYRDKLPKFRLYNPENYQSLQPVQFIKYAFVFGLLAILLGNGVGYVIEKLIQPPHTQNLITSFIVNNPLPGFLFACVIAPIWEELFFRGFVFKSLAKKWGYWAGSISSATIFAFMHIEVINIRSILYILLVLGGVGMLLNYTFKKYQNLALNMTIHGLLNFSSFVLLMLWK